MEILIAQVILKNTSLDEPLVAFMLVLVLVLSVLVLYTRPSIDRLRRSFIVFSIAIFVLAIPIFWIEPETYLKLLGENHVVEWLTAHFLFAAVVFGGRVNISAGKQLRAAPDCRLECQYPGLQFGSYHLQSRPSVAPNPPRSYSSDSERNSIFESDMPLVVSGWIMVHLSSTSTSR